MCVFITGERESVGKSRNPATGKLEHTIVTEPEVQFSLISKNKLNKLPSYFAETIANSADGTGLCLWGGYPWANMSAKAMDKFRYDIRKALIC